MDLFNKKARFAEKQDRGQNQSLYKAMHTSLDLYKKERAAVFQIPAEDQGAREQSMVQFAKTVDLCTSVVTEVLYSRVRPLTPEQLVDVLDFLAVGRQCLTITHDRDDGSGYPCFREDSPHVAAFLAQAHDFDEKESEAIDLLGEALWSAVSGGELERVERNHWPSVLHKKIKNKIEVAVFNDKFNSAPRL